LEKPNSKLESEEKENGNVVKRTLEDEITIKDYSIGILRDI